MEGSGLGGRVTMMGVLPHPFTTTPSHLLLVGRQNYSPIVISYVDNAKTQDQQMCASVCFILQISFHSFAKVFF